MRLLLAATVLIASTAAKAAGPITVLGINIEMSRANVERVLTNKGYTCRHEGKGGGYVLSCRVGKPSDIIEIRFVATEIIHLITVAHIETIAFSCASLDLCDKSLDERRRALIAAKYVETLEPGCSGKCFVARGAAGDRLVVGSRVRVERR